jgi:hypothetical protein
METGSEMKAELAPAESIQPRSRSSIPCRYSMLRMRIL